MDISFRIVNIYVDKNNNLLIIPTGESKKLCGALIDLDIVNKLQFPYSDEDLEEILKKSLNECFSKKPNDLTSESSLERYLNVKGFSKAVKDRKLVVFGWNCDEGYYVIPTNKIPKRGFVDIEDKKFDIGKELRDGILAKAIKASIQIAK